MITYRNATFADIEAVHSLINEYARQGVMLARSRNALYETMRDMMLAFDGNALVGVAGLHIVWDRLAEVRSVAIDPAHKRRGIGGELVRRLIDAAQPFGIDKVFTLTYQAAFFRSLGFAEIAKDELPPKIWKDCIDCPKFPNCDEIAMIRPMPAR